MRAHAVALLFVFVAGGALAETPEPEVCVATPEEVTLTKATVARMVRRPDLSPIYSQVDRAEGCGVWRVTVTPKGTIAKLELIRGQAKPDYELLLRRPILRTTFQPSETEWVGMLQFIIKAPD